MVFMGFVLESGFVEQGYPASWPGLSRPSTSSLLKLRKKDVDARDKRGHDGGEMVAGSNGIGLPQRRDLLGVESEFLERRIGMLAEARRRRHQFARCARQRQRL